MRIVRLLGVVLAALIAAPVWAASVLDLKTEYSAVSTIHTSKAARQGRLWRTPTALRHEGVDGDRRHTVIARLDQKVAWLLVPEQKLAIEMSLENFGLPVDLLNGGGIKQTPVGQETVAGMRTTKVKVEREPGPKGNGHFEGYVWTTAEGIIMRVVGSGENQGRRGDLNVSFSDVKIARQDPSLFELPAGYRRLALVGVDFETLMAGLEGFKALTKPNRAGSQPPR